MKLYVTFIRAVLRPKNCMEHLVGLVAPFPSLLIKFQVYMLILVGGCVHLVVVIVPTVIALVDEKNKRLTRHTIEIKLAMLVNFCF